MVIVVIGVLIGILLPALAKARRQAKKRQCLVEMRVIKSAIVAYHMEARNWPDAANTAEEYSGNNAAVVGVLTSSVPPLLDAANLRSDSRGVLDPWMIPYRIRVDKDHDGLLKGTADPLPDGVSVTSTSPESQ